MLKHISFTIFMPIYMFICLILFLCIVSSIKWLHKICAHCAIEALWTTFKGLFMVQKYFYAISSNVIPINQMYM